MSSKTETGHAKNVANFKTLISFTTGYGAKYAPYPQSLTLASLNNLAVLADQALEGVKDSKTVLDNAINDRRIQFAPLKPFSTQVVKVFSSSDVPAEAIADAQGHKRKIQGARAKAITPADPAAPVPTENAQTKRISVSQLSFDNQLDNFKSLVKTVLSQQSYQPTETEMSEAGLKQKVQQLEQSNTAVINSTTDWSNARINRDNVLYHKKLGLRAVAQGVKKYVAGVFGTTSKEYRQISALKFTSIPK